MAMVRTLRCLLLSPVSRASHLREFADPCNRELQRPRQSRRNMLLDQLQWALHRAHDVELDLAARRNAKASRTRLGIVT
jgi:hypothetical protein